MSKYDWKRLLSDGRKRETNIKNRTAFEADLDKVLFSPCFRRLAGKTQVFPIPVDISIHSRLTHSLEVASISRSFGYKIQEETKNVKSLSLLKDKDIKSLLQAAALAHDIGNPPFGHEGERGLSKWFENQNLKNHFSHEQLRELQTFEGNAQGFRYIVNKETYGGAGLGLTYATLASSIKYPWSFENRPKKEDQKYNWFKSEEESGKQIWEKLGLNDIQRHPFSYLIEAADDICNPLIDLEDSVDLKVISVEEAIRLLEYIYRQQGLNNKSKVKTDTGTLKHVRKLTRGLLPRLIQIHYEPWRKVYLSGTDSKIVKLEKSAGEPLKTIIETLKKKSYTTPHVLKLESTGRKILSGLCEVFISPEALCSSNMPKELYLLPEPTQRLFTKISQNEKEGKYLYARGVIDYLAGCSDKYALNLYRELHGIELPTDR